MKHVGEGAGLKMVPQPASREARPVVASLFFFKADTLSMFYTVSGSKCVNGLPCFNDVTVQDASIIKTIPLAFKVSRTLIALYNIKVG